MKLPMAFFAALVPLHSSLAAAIATTAVYGLLSILGYGLFSVWDFFPYLEAAAGAGGKFLGFLFRSIFLVNNDINLWAAATVFSSAGMSTCTCAQASVLADWFKNASAAQQLSFHHKHPHILPAICKLMAIPVIVFGPVVGTPAALLMYGVRTPDAARHAMMLRKYTAWGTLACLAILIVISLLALWLVALQHQRSAGSSVTPVLLVASVVLSFLLLETSGATRVRAIYQPDVATNDRLWYTLVVLPELLQQLLTTFPTLLISIGMADRYQGWRTGSRGWVLRVSPQQHAEDPESSSTKTKGSNAIVAAACIPSSQQHAAACDLCPTS